MRCFGFYVGYFFEGIDGVGEVLGSYFDFLEVFVSYRFLGF